MAKKKSRAKDDFRVSGLSKSSNEVSETETREMVTGIVLRMHCTGNTEVWFWTHYFGLLMYQVSDGDK